MVEYLEIFKGDDTDFSLNQTISIKLITDYSLDGCTAHVKFYDYVQTFYPITDNKLPLVFPSSATSKFPLGRGSAKIWLTDGEGKIRTVANDLKILVTNNVDLLSRSDISYSLLIKYNYNDLDGKPYLNGKLIEGDHTAEYYGIKGTEVDTEMSETSENPVQNKVITARMIEDEDKIDAVDENLAGLVDKFDFSDPIFSELTTADTTARIKQVINALVGVLKTIK